MALGGFRVLGIEMNHNMKGECLLVIEMERFNRCRRTGTRRVTTLPICGRSA